MRMGTLDRRDEASCCVVCGSKDLRSLSFTRLLGGERVAVCGSHKVAHHRSETIAQSVDELCKLVGERRTN